MKDFPLVSVITTVYNTEKYVERCFDSVMEQTYPNIEFIVVNNGSSGNIEEIVEKYRAAYPKRIIKIKTFEENQGVYHARIAGADIATGEYIAFIDSDDRISVDFYRHLISIAEEKHADIVMANVIYEKPSGELYYQNHNPWHNEGYEFCGKDILDFYLKQEGSLFSANFIWNKLISMQLWEKAYGDICNNKNKIVMYDDMALNLPLYYYAENMVKTTLVQYYYYQNVAASSKGSDEPKRYERIFKDIENSFAVMENFLIRHKVSCYEDNIKNWKHRYCRVWENEVVQSNLAHSEQRRLLELLKSVLGVTESSENFKNKDNFFYDIISPYKDDLENQIKKIINKKTKYVSFDVFDTLVIRPTIEPTDVFNILGDYINSKRKNSYYIDFRALRIDAEKRARTEVFSRMLAPEDIGIEAIYKKLEIMLPMSQRELADLMNKEVAIEKEVCRYRLIGKYLYEIASDIGKKIICISDMYLHGKDISEILAGCGYQNITKVFSSADVLLTKNSGNLYKHVISQLKIKPSEIVHIGDNYYSDVCMAQKAGLQVIHLISGKDNMFGANHVHFHGSFTKRTYLKTTDGQHACTFWGIRSQLGLVANKLFDNPFEDYNQYSDFDGSPYAVGYYILGSYILATCLWLKEQISGKGYKKIHFIARDGWIFKQAYDKMFANRNDMPKSNYLRVSRKALFPLAVRTAEDLFIIYSFYNLCAFTPQKIIKYLEPIIPKEKQETIGDLMRKSGIILDKKFVSLGDWQLFATIFKEQVYDQATVDAFREKMKGYFDTIFTEHDCTFDAGYSGRTESILTLLLNNRIDAYYLHFNESRCLESCKKLKFSVKALHPTSAPVPRMVFLETLISDFSGTCVGYKENAKREIEPVLGAPDLNFQSMYTFSRIHKGAIDFVLDWKNCVANSSIESVLRYQDLLLPFNSFIASAKLCEKYLFSAAYFDDPLFFDNVQSVQKVFDQLQEESQSWQNLIGVDNVASRWKSTLILLMVDRKTLKEKVKSKYAAHPIFLKILKMLYSIPRSIYHLLKP